MTPPIARGLEFNASAIFLYVVTRPLGIWAHKSNTLNWKLVSLRLVLGLIYSARSSAVSGNGFLSGSKGHLALMMMMERTVDQPSPGQDFYLQYRRQKARLLFRQVFCRSGIEQPFCAMQVEVS